MYSIYVEVYSALYSTYPATKVTSLSHPLNSYVYVLSLGLAGFSGIVTASP